MTRLLGSAALVAVLTAGCVVSGQIRPTVDASTSVDISSLWQEPIDIASRDLFHGAGGAELMPDPDATFTFVAADSSGYSPGYDVKDASGVEWSVKSGAEAQTEIVLSRILWAIGYHQPPTYYLASWTMTGEQAGPKEGGRFRPKLPHTKVVADWSWYENQFIHTQPFKGLIVVNVMLNNWDWKTSNNKIYEVAAEGQGPRRLYVVQDLGASLGKTDYPRALAWLPMRGLGQGSRNDLEGFEQQGFIERVEDDRVEFVYRGIHRSLLDLLTARDVAWAAGQLSRISDSQWQDAFRAAAYPEDQAQRFIAKIKSKIANGVALSTPDSQLRNSQLR